MIENLLILFFAAILIYQIFSSDYEVEGFKMVPPTSNVREGNRNAGGSGMMDRVLKNHDEIVKIKATLDTKYKPLIETSDGKPQNLLTKIAVLESDISALQNAQYGEQEGRINEYEKGESSEEKAKKAKAREKAKAIAEKTKSNLPGMK